MLCIGSVYYGHANFDLLGGCDLVNIIHCSRFISRKQQSYFPFHKRKQNKDSHLCRVLNDHIYNTHINTHITELYHLVKIIEFNQMTEVNVT